MEQSGTAAENGDGGMPEESGRPTRDPVFVLCMGRSGSTLLRLILDTHPDLACPPETNIPALCGQLAVVWSLIEGAPLSPQRGDEPPEIPDTAIAGIRQTMNLMTAPYLSRRGKRLLCDKSLSAARFAELLMRVYPGTRFLCLFRHPMDVISSGIEACPWGLNGYGFDQYIVGSPGNVVLALARYWNDEAHAIAAVEEKYPDRCHRVRYEDVVRDPERVAAGVFDFIGVDQVPGISGQVFSGDHERFGPADHKIWHTSAISQESVGRSETVPVGLIPPPILESINELAGKLGYVTVDERWGTADMPATLLAPESESRASASQDHRQPLETRLLADRLESMLTRIDAFAGRWQPHAAETFTVVVREPHSLGQVRWQVDLAARTIVMQGQDGGPGYDAGEGADWGLVGSAEAWQAVLSGRLNLSVALRRCDLRYCDYDDNDALVSDTRIAMLAALLGVTSWQPARTPH